MRNESSWWARWSLSAIPVIAGVALSSIGCGRSDGPAQWAGSVDTLPSGLVHVANPAAGSWDEESAWIVTEEMRIGSPVGNGPDLFGRITDFAVDPTGRMYVFDGQAQELRVFDSDGSHVRTIGRKGGGPGEFEQVIGMDWAPSGELWLVDPSNNRISVIDTAGTYVTSHQTLGGFVIVPWPGGFDERGFFYNYAMDPNPGDEDLFPLVLVRYDDELNPLDTTSVPRYRGERHYFEMRSNGGFMRASVPYSPGVTWRLAKTTGDIWFAETGVYEVYQRTFEGDTVRLITKEFSALPVTQDDLDEARENLEWFTRQGGEIDLTRVPDHKPALRGFFVDRGGNLWVEPVVTTERQGRVFDLFDRDGRYRGEIVMPFLMQTNPTPVLTENFIYAITTDELEVPYLVRARLGRPSTDTGDVTVGGR